MALVLFVKKLPAYFLYFFNRTPRIFIIPAA